MLGFAKCVSCTKAACCAGFQTGAALDPVGSIMSPLMQGSNVRGLESEEQVY